MKPLDYNKLFSVGEEVSLNQVLENREKRVAFTKYLLEKRPDSTVVTFKLNTPGPIKTNLYLENLWENCENKFEDLLSGFSVVFKKKFLGITGPESFFVVDQDSKSLKKACIDFESTPIGRLFDIDVLSLENNTPTTISRENMGIPERECFVCSRPAKVCGSRRLHSVDELQKAFIGIALENRG